MSTFIDLLRHGETASKFRYCGSTNHPLTPFGWTQMWQAIENHPTQWQQIVTSPLARCADFARVIGLRYTIPVAYDEHIQEIHFGDWEDRSSTELMQTDADALVSFWQNPLNHPPPNGEHLLNFEARVLSAWYAIQQQFDGKKVLLVTHSGVIRIIIRHILQLSLERMLELEIKHASIMQIQIDSDQSSQAILISGLKSQSEHCSS
ncbi:alpha-ribazole phosphatase family protein [Nitrosomonas sp.]|uniref:alpha-ribazole phosphatase family protein n=1 Tax=Nitrosomonas sp. TaxID=42353 RepID=UPI001DF0FCFF|nr:alpha-ribazole phosphatase family protein [Nitrosomonas sp.]MBX3616455.1 alpha-ribazole phosphatase family protein [Nitrosomonas sp.]